MLTRQLLAFGRKQCCSPCPLNLNQVAEGIEKMLRRILGEDIDFVQVLAPDLGVVRADPGQIEQVLMNLVVNARDAMSEGGKLTIETSNANLDEEFTAHHVAVVPGPYVRLAVTDTGCGMGEQTKAQLFEPFFTTKEKGKGTGLGLSTVYGIVKQSGGNIWVHSRAAPGHDVQDLFSAGILAQSDVHPTVSHPAASYGGTETILVVEDEEAMRKVAMRSLEAAGYKVLVAAGGDEALRIAAEHAGHIHLLLADMVMPRMSGRALAQEFRRRIGPPRSCTCRATPAMHSRTPAASRKERISSPSPLPQATWRTRFARFWTAAATRHPDVRAKACNRHVAPSPRQAPSAIHRAPTTNE